MGDLSRRPGRRPPGRPHRESVYVSRERPHVGGTRWRALGIGARQLRGRDAGHGGGGADLPRGGDRPAVPHSSKVAGASIDREVPDPIEPGFTRTSAGIDDEHIGQLAEAIRTNSTDQPVVLLYACSAGAIGHGVRVNPGSIGSGNSRSMLAPATLELSIVSALLAMAVGLAMGVYTALNRDGWLSRAFMFGSTGFRAPRHSLPEVRVGLDRRHRRPCGTAGKRNRTARDRWRRHAGRPVGQGPVRRLSLT